MKLAATLLILFGAVPVKLMMGQTPATDDDWTRCRGPDPAQRIVACTAIIERNQDSLPRIAGAYFGRAYAEAIKGDVDRAIHDYDESIARNPSSAAAFNNRGLLYRRKGDLDRAIQDYSDAIQLNPKYALALNNRGYAYLGKGDRDHALADWDTVLTLGTNAGTLYCRGVVRLARSDTSGRQDIAAATSQQANVADRQAKNCPSDNEAPSGICTILGNRSMLRIAVSAVETVLRLRGDSSASLARLVVPIVTRNISETSLRQLVSFYQSPKAQLLSSAAQPLVLRNTSDTNRQCFTTLGSAVAEDLNRRGIKLH